MNNSLRVYISEKNHGSIILILHHDYYWNKTCVIMVRSTKQYGTFFYLHVLPPNCENTHVKQTQ